MPVVPMQFIDEHGPYKLRVMNGPGKHKMFLKLTPAVYKVFETCLITCSGNYAHVSTNCISMKSGRVQLGVKVDENTSTDHIYWDTLDDRLQVLQNLNASGHCDTKTALIKTYSGDTCSHHTPCYSRCVVLGRGVVTSVA
jgi:hypothetical protein